MMRPSNDLPEVHLCRDAIDFRKGINGMAVLVGIVSAWTPSPNISLCSATDARIVSRFSTGNAVASACGKSVWRGPGSTGRVKALVAEHVARADRLQADKAAANQHIVRLDAKVFSFQEGPFPLLPLCLRGP